MTHRRHQTESVFTEQATTAEHTVLRCSGVKPRVTCTGHTTTIYLRWDFPNTLKQKPISSLDVFKYLNNERVELQSILFFYYWVSKLEGIGLSIGQHLVM